MDPLKLIDRGPILPVTGIDRIDDADPLPRASVDGGVRVLEATLRTPTALQSNTGDRANGPIRSPAPTPCPAPPMGRRARAAQTLRS